MILIITLVHEGFWYVWYDVLINLLCQEILFVLCRTMYIQVQSNVISRKYKKMNNHFPKNIKNTLKYLK